jgi:hypothetical protein
MLLIVLREDDTCILANYCTKLGYRMDYFIYCYERRPIRPFLAFFAKVKVLIGISK